MRIELQAPLQDLGYLSKLFGARIQVCGRENEKVFGIATDTREIQTGDLFVALKGEHNDGNAYIGEAIAAGARAVLTDNMPPCAAENVSFLLCDNVQDALLRAAGEWRRLCGAKVIAVTGSAGKTTTKEAIACVLGDVPHNAGNYNSTVGMPLSVLSFPKNPFWVCELGINHVGEMEKMSLALRPDVGVITNVGSAHIGNFGDMATILCEKLKICAGMDRTGVLVLPHSLKMGGYPTPSCRVVFVGEEGDADFRQENIVMGKNGVSCDLRFANGDITNLTWPIPGRIGTSVLGLSAATGVLCGRSADQIRVGLQRAAALPLRTHVYPMGEMLFLEDCYNASPEACLGALETLRYLSGDRVHVAVLGDMLELGNYSGILHRMLGASLPKSGVSYLFTYGTQAAQIAIGAREAGMDPHAVFSFAKGERERIAQAMLRHIPRDAAVLFKGSRAMQMERVVEEIRRLL